MDEKENVRESEIDLRAILLLLKRNLALLIVVSALFGVVTFLFSKYFLPKKYQASAMIIVNNLSDDQATVNSSEILAAQNLADVSAIIITSDTVLQEVINREHLDMSCDELRKCVSVSSVNSTQVINISMIHEDPDIAKAVVASIVEVAPPIIREDVEAGSVEDVGDATLSNNGAPVSPNSTRNALIGAAAGLALALAFVFITEFTNHTFKTEEDVTDVLKIPLLGIIPAVETKEFNKNV